MGEHVVVIKIDEENPQAYSLNVNNRMRLGDLYMVLADIAHRIESGEFDKESDEHPALEVSPPGDADDILN